LIYSVLLNILNGKEYTHPSNIIGVGS